MRRFYKYNGGNPQPSRKSLLAGCFHWTTRSRLELFTYSPWPGHGGAEVQDNSSIVGPSAPMAVNL